MTEQQFINLLTQQWPDVPVMLKHLSLLRIVNYLAVDAFIHNYEGLAIDVLREQIKRIQDGKGFLFTD